ncbi:MULTISPECIES: hypothetical protein [Sutcliffiella]|uniref:Alpha/beta hydrolase n=1 Tax=Sutcliffiella cohnii TaxID=33932 RepID=A0A223KVW1_9BACI|nr:MULTISPECIES: hypothetical protein [Sutcliffiella]AST93560.1 hypothetical protein BC6307_20965 [Sutcliffiella cohnii]WBL14748.1 hypothetical protein O1A01_23210 [Sutcliffiella sp. NC1]
MLFIHGLGEDRTGINYFFASEAKKLYRMGYSTCQFNLIGLGDENGIPNLETWVNQLDLVLRFLTSSFPNILIIARGICRVLFSTSTYNGKIILLGHSNKNDYDLSYINRYIDNDWVKVPQNDVYSTKEEKFWLNLAVETSSIGGLHLPLSLFQQLESKLTKKCYVDYLFSLGDEKKDSTLFYRNSISFPNVDPLLRKEVEREIVSQKISEVLMEWKRKKGD